MDNAGLIRSPSPIRGFKYYLGCRLKKRPFLVNLEVTKRCNARCGFCSYWHTEHPQELPDYTDVVKKLRPVVLSISGGEPLLRKDIHEIIKGVRPYCHYLVMVTNGTILTEEVADRLSMAGLNQLAVSLDFADERHDEARGVTGLFKKVSKMVPRLASKGYKVVLNTVIMESNMGHIIALAHMARSWGAGISFSAYCSLKKGDEGPMIEGGKLKQLEDIVAELKLLKRMLGHIKNSDYYLNGIPRYFRNGGMESCKAGLRWVQVTPDGYIKPCSELPVMCRYDEYGQERVPEITCTECWYTCRGEAEASHLAPDRLAELIRS